MSLIKKPSELEINDTVSILLYGQPGVSKTTTSLSAPKPLLFDVENGISRVQPEFRVDTVQVKSYQDILDVLNEDLSEYKTLVFDTINEVLVYIEKYLISTKPKAVSADNKLNMYGYGLRSMEFKNLIQKIKGMGKNIIFIAHETETVDDDKKIIRPDITGKASAEIIKFLDCVGYMEMVGKNRTISFMPCSKYYAKNSIGLEDYISIPKLEHNSINNFLTEEIIKPTLERRKEEIEEIKKEEEKFLKAKKLIDDNGFTDEVKEKLNALKLSKFYVIKIKNYVKGLENV